MAGLILLGGAAVPSARARDFWLEPEGALASKGEEVALHLRAGTRFKTEEERPLQKERTARFELYADGVKKRDLLATGTDGQTPAARVRLEGGATLAVMDRTARPITMDRERFNRYLADEGLDAAADQRAKTGQSEQGAREVYSRYLKALIAERETHAPNTLYKRRVGERLEIVLENDPDRLGPGRALGVQVLFEGKGLAGTRVTAFRRGGTGDAPPVALTATTNAGGVASFKLDQPGTWLVRAVHLREVITSATRPNLAGAQWESFWAAYVFAAREVAGSGVAGSGVAGAGE